MNAAKRMAEHRTAMARANDRLMLAFDNEIANWAERIATQPRLADIWPDHTTQVTLYRRRLRHDRKNAPHRLTLAYLHMCADRVVDDNLPLDPTNRRMLGRTIARLSERIAQLGAR